jgi:hypothetical protein
MKRPLGKLEFLPGSRVKSSIKLRLGRIKNLVDKELPPLGPRGMRLLSLTPIQPALRDEVDHEAQHDPDHD